MESTGKRGDPGVKCRHHALRFYGSNIPEFVAPNLVSVLTGIVRGPGGERDRTQMFLNHIFRTDHMDSFWSLKQYLSSSDL